MNAETEINGENSRIAGRDYFELNIKDEDNNKPLTQVQRDDLNSTVKSLSSEYDVETWVIWKYTVHRALGVESVDEITQAKYRQAVDELEKYRAQQKLERDQVAIHNRITEVVAEKRLECELKNYMLCEFGKTEISDLAFDDLLKTLRHVEQFDIGVVPQAVQQSSGFIKRLNLELAIGVGLGAVLAAMFYEFWVIPTL